VHAIRILLGVAALLSGALACNPTPASAGSGQCMNAVHVQPSDEVTVRIDAGAPPVKRIDPAYFGFNVEWVGFQDDLWDGSTKRIQPEVAAWLRKLDGAIYRYPGGTVANHFIWRDATGPQRNPQKAVDWTGPIPALVGIDEYFSFLNDVGGQAWLVANLYGEFGHEHPIEQVSDDARHFAASVSSAAKAARVPVVRWELGNELDRGNGAWSAEKYSSRAGRVAAAIRQSAPDAHFVAIWPDYDAYPGVPATEYVRRSLAALPPEIDEFAQHMYFDGPPGGPPVPNRLMHMCSLLQAAERSSRPGRIWVTEFGRWPPGNPEDPNWKNGFPLTANLESAIGIADFIIGTTQIRDIEGTQIHNLSSSKGPWPMFHRNRGHFVPSAVFDALLVLRQGLIGDVLPTTVAAPMDARSRSPMVRATAVASADRKAYRLSLVNRGDRPVSVHIAGLPAGAAARLTASLIADENRLANNYAVADRVAIAHIDEAGLKLDRRNGLSIEVPEHAVMAVEFLP
jgi:alpha-N-arabinofuranosidase